MLTVMDYATQASFDSPLKDSQTKEKWTETEAKIHADF